MTSKKPKYVRRRTVHPWFPLHPELVFDGSFARDNTKESVLLFLMLRGRANACGIASIVVDEDDFYTEYLTEQEADKALSLLIEKGYIDYDDRRGNALIRSFFASSRMSFSSPPTFNRLAAEAKAVGSPRLRVAIAEAIVRCGPDEMHPEVRAAVPELVNALAKDRASAIIAEWESGGAVE